MDQHDGRTGLPPQATKTTGLTGPGVWLGSDAGRTAWMRGVDSRSGPATPETDRAKENPPRRALRGGLSDGEDDGT
jgi:hypothetical protein